VIAAIAVILGLLLVGGFGFLIYRAMRTYDAGSHATFITSKGGEYYGALRAPITLWDPSIKVLKDKHAPDMTFMTHDASGAEYFEKSLVNRRTGEISLRVHTCAPRPFISRTTENRQIRIRSRVAFQLDVDRIQIPTQMQAFGATLGARIENLFDNAIGEYTNEEVRSKQGEIESKVLRQLQDVEFPLDPAHPTGMPLGIKIYEATFSYEPVMGAGVGGGDGSHISRGPMALTPDDLDDMLDMLKEAKPEVVDTLRFMMELQTRQNIVDLLCKSGGLVAFTAQELGLSERAIDRSKSGINIMKPVPADVSMPVTVSGGDGGAAMPVEPPTYQQLAAAYYSLGPPKRK
jgi:hypothetical protein